VSAREERASEWPSIRLGLAGACLLVALAVAAWAAETASTDEPSRLAQTERCLRREKLLDVRPPKRDPIAAEAGDGALATRVEGNGLHILLAGSEREAARLAAAYRQIGGELRGRLEVRDTVVYVWEGAATPTQRQTAYDCAY
jgi:hypothetical protein